VPATSKKRIFNWKAQEDDGKPKVILQAVTRTSEGNDGTFAPIRNRDELLAMIETNRKMQLALKNKKGKPYHPGLKGLFGGGG
jgi:hypothetical protein